MTDNEFASKIYCKVYEKINDDGDAYVRGIFDALCSLEEREQLVLEYYYRHENTYEFIADRLYIDKNTCRRIVAEAMKKLRHQSRMRKMSVRVHIEARDKIIDELRSLLDAAAKQIEELSLDVPDDYKLPNIVAANLTKLSEIGLPSYTCNILSRKGISSIEALLRLDSLEALIAIQGFGLHTRNDLITKMRDYGHKEWADKMDAEWSCASGLSFETYKSRLSSKYRGSY